MVRLFLVLFWTLRLPVAEAANSRLAVRNIGQSHVDVGSLGVVPVFLSSDWTRPQPEIRRALLMLHGHLRDAETYFQSAQAATLAAGAAGSGTLIIVPQFLALVDRDAHHLPLAYLYWSRDGWMGGETALGPGPASSFDAVDAVVAKLADRRLYPNLKDVVIAGHSGGAQVVQRYAMAGKGDVALTRRGIAVRYVVANASSYAYFSADRPQAQIAAACSGFNSWKYGMEARPPYLAKDSVKSLETAYLARRVIYLLGTKDTDPADDAIDKTCMAIAQGRDRYTRGHAYADWMTKRYGRLVNHQTIDVLGVGHDAKKMFTSVCGLKALFDTAGCEPVTPPLAPSP